MANIGGVTEGTFQIKTTEKNSIGEAVKTWAYVCSKNGWLGLQNGDSKYINMNAKIEESTHVFLCDYDSTIYSLRDQDTRMIMKGVVYDVLIIDNPDEMDEQLEIYLRRVGAYHG